jgi:FkbM family methyltransferase
MFKLLFIKLIKFILKKFKVGLTSYDNLLFPHHTKEFIHEKIITSSDGILHVGAHFGEERDYYGSLNLNVYWIEAVPQFYEILKKNISEYPNQIAKNYLLGNQDHKIMKFYLANNEGASSSIFELSKENGFKGLEMTESMEIETRRLDSLLSLKEVQIYSNWVIDAQGSELQVLEGAEKLLGHVSSIMVEVSTREIYVGGTNYHDLKRYLRKHSFIPLWEPKGNSHEDILFIRTHY